MPSRLGTPVLTVDTEKIHKVDTANAQSLHGMWMGKLVFFLQFLTWANIKTFDSVLEMRRLYGPRTSFRKLKLEIVDAGDILRGTGNFE